MNLNSKHVKLLYLMPRCIIPGIGLIKSFKKNESELIKH